MARPSVGAGGPLAACGQFTPPPLAKELTVLLNPQSDIKYFLDGTFEAVEIVVNQSCERKRKKRTEVVSVKEGLLRGNINTLGTSTQ